MEGDRKNEIIKAFIEPFELAIDEGTSLIDNPIFEPWMHQI